MFVVHQFEVRVIRMVGGVSQAVTGATVTLTPEAIGPVLAAAWDATRGVYHVDGAAPGFYALAVTAAGFVDVARRVQVHPKRSLELVLMTAGADADFDVAFPISFPERHDVVGVFPRVGDAGARTAGADGVAADAAARAGMDNALRAAGFERVAEAPATDTSEERGAVAVGVRLERAERTAPILVRAIGNRLSARRDPRLAALRRDPLVRAAGPVVFSDGDTFTAVLNAIDVRFRPEVTRRERERLLAEHGLTIAATRNLGTPVYLAQADDAVGLEIYEIAARLRATGRVDYAEPSTAQRWGVDAVNPPDFLWPGCWDRQTATVHEAWGLLAAAGLPASGDPTFGDSRIVVGVMDTGIESQGGVVVNPDFNGTVSDGSPKVVALYDFATNVPNNDVPLSGNPHGVNVAGVSVASAGNTNGATGTAFGLPGAAPNARVIGLIGAYTGFWSDPGNADAYRWATGVSGVEPGMPAPLADGADVMTCSLTFGAGAPISSVARDTLDLLSRRARGGRGALCFFSAGNSPTQNNETYRPWGWHERAFSCAGSTLDQTSVEIRYPSSSKGQVEWCAPTGRFAPPHNPPTNYRTWGGAHLHRGNLPSEAVLQTDLAAAAAAGATSITVTNPAGLVVGTYLLLGLPGALGHEPVLVSAVDAATGVVTVSALLNAHPLAEPVISGGELRATTTVATAVGGAMLTVDDASKISGGDTVIVGVGASAEYVTVTAPPDPVAGTIPVSAMTKVHGIGSSVWRGGYHHSNSFGGTSSATPLAAGIGALVLSARPRLTWVEAAELLRNTAERIQAANVDPEGQWLDANGDPIALSLGSPTFSFHFGHGRLDAQRAVAAALAYAYPRDLIVRNSLADDGTTAQPAVQDSPDIWVRNADPAVDPSPFPASVAVAGPHEDPEYGTPRWVYARVRNRGSVTSLPAWVRVYVASATGAAFVWPADFEAINGVGNADPANWDAGTYLLGEVGIEHVPPGGEAIVSLPWPDALVPPPVTTAGTPFNPVLLVEITPQDGPLEGAGIVDNNNLAQRAVTILDAAPPEIAFVEPGEVPLRSLVNVASAVPSVAVPFEIRVTDLGVIVAESVSFSITWRHRDGTETTVDFAHAAGAWPPSAPPPAAFTVAAPVDASGIAVTGNTLEARFACSFAAIGAFETVRIGVHAQDVSGNVTPAAAGTRIVEIAIPADVVVVLDYSGSMTAANASGQTRWASASEAANLFQAVFGSLVGGSPLDHRLGLVRFWSDGHAGPDMTEVTHALAAPDLASDLVTAALPAAMNYTPIGSGIVSAAAALGAGTATWRHRIALLLTDGIENRDPRIADIRAAAMGDPAFVPSVEDDAQGGIRIHSCAFGPAEDVSSEAIQALADGGDGGKSYGGVFHATSSTADPHAAFALKEQMLSMLTDSLPAELTGPFNTVVVIEPGVDELVLVVTDGVPFTVTPPPEHVAPIAAVQMRPGYAWVRVSSPAPGVWTLAGFTPGPAVRAFAVVDLRLRASFTIGAQHVGVGLPLPLRAEIHDGGVAVSGARVTARIEGPDESVGEVLTAASNRLSASSLTTTDRLSPQSLMLKQVIDLRQAPLRRFTRTIALHETVVPGRYEADWSRTLAEGTYTVFFHAEGTNRDGVPFSRDYSASRYLAPVPDPGYTTLRWIATALDPRRMRWTAAVTPRSASGRALGPGLAHALMATAGTGRPATLEDRLDGTYAVQFDVAAGAPPPSLALQWGARAVALRHAPGTARRVRVVLERVRVTTDKERWFPSPGEIVFRSVVAPDGDPARAMIRRVPPTGTLRLADGEAATPGTVLYDALVEEGTRLVVQITGTELDQILGITLNKDEYARYRRVLRGPIESWAGQYRPDDEPGDPEGLADWSVWYRIDVE